jgi:hypothetical protein
MAYQDREPAGFRKTVSALAWGFLAWFVSEPSQIVKGDTRQRLVSYLSNVHPLDRPVLPAIFGHLATSEEQDTASVQGST